MSQNGLQDAVQKDVRHRGTGQHNDCPNALILRGGSSHANHRGPRPGTCPEGQGRSSGTVSPAGVVSSGSMCRRIAQKPMLIGQASGMHMVVPHKVKAVSMKDIGRSSADGKGNSSMAAEKMMPAITI